MADRKTPAEEAADLRAATREAHEAMKDMRGLIQQVATLKTEVEQVAATVFAERMEESIVAGLAGYSETIGSAIDDATKAVHKRFDTLLALVLGEGMGEESIEALVRRRIGADKAPLPEGTVPHSLVHVFAHDDGRICGYHESLDLWVFEGGTLQCLRDGHPAMRRRA